MKTQWNENLDKRMLIRKIYSRYPLEVRLIEISTNGTWGKFHNMLSGNDFWEELENNVIVDILPD